MRGYYQYYVHDLVNGMESLPATELTGQVKVSTAGTAVQLSTSSQELRGGIWFRPLDTTKMYVGYANQKPDGTNAVTCDISNPLFLEADNLNEWWIDAASNNTTMSYLAF